MKKRILILFTLICLSFNLSAKTPLDKIVVFGDSLSDYGNFYEYMKHEVPPSPPYFEGRFSNDTLWIEKLAEALFPDKPSEHVLNYAFGGAGVSEEDGLITLKGEIDSYLLAHPEKPSDQTLFVVWIGANNYLGLPEDIEQTTHDVVSGIQQQIKRLANSGAQHILLFNLPNLGKTPFAYAYQVNQQLENLSLQHNDKIQQAFQDLSHEYPNTQWLFLDVQQFFNEILQNPKPYGFNNVVDACIDLNDNRLVQSTHPAMLTLATHAKHLAKTTPLCDDHFFFDFVHPTGKVHRIIAETVKDYLQKSL